MIWLYFPELAAKLAEKNNIDKKSHVYFPFCHDYLFFVISTALAMMPKASIIHF